MKNKYLVATLCTLFVMLFATSISSHAATENQVGQITKSTAKIYKSASKKAKATTVNTADLQRTFYVRESKKADNTTYYRLYKSTTSIGWVDKKMLKLSKRTVLSKEKKTMYVMTSGYASTMPAGTSANRSYDLTKYRAKSIAVERHEKVGTTEWYKGRIAGTTKLRWVKADALTTNGFVSVDLRKPSNVTAKDLQALLLAKGKTPTNVLYRLAPEFIKAQASTGVSAQFMFAHAALETGWGSSTIAQYKNNLFGYQAYDTCPITCSKYFPHGEAGLKLYASKIVNNYLVTSGAYYNGKTVLDMNVRYATDPAWGQKIANIMQQIKPFKSSYYAKVKASTKKVVASTDYGSVIPAGKATPAAFVKMPTAVKGTVSASSAVIYSIPYTYAPRLGSYKKGKTMTIQAYHTDVKEFTNSSNGKSRWYRIAYNGTQGWVRSDQVKTTNLAFTSVDSTLRSGAGTKYTKVGSAVKNTPLKLVISSGKVVTKKDTAKKVWYQAYHPSAPSKKLWIRSDLVTIYR
ncbi:MAG: glucosaminidase domain-containing protein [Kurthia sp.]|nr:glucosaminidase domain-containing protein [Candidatus Kurthia equi]